MGVGDGHWLLLVCDMAGSERNRVGPAGHLGVSCQPNVNVSRALPCPNLYTRTLRGDAAASNNRRVLFAKLISMPGSSSGGDNHSRGRACRSYLFREADSQHITSPASDVDGAKAGERFYIRPEPSAACLSGGALSLCTACFTGHLAGAPHLDEQPEDAAARTLDGPGCLCSTLG